MRISDWSSDVCSSDLAPGKTVSQTSRLFVGAKETKLLERYQDEGVTLFDRAIDWGWFYWFEKPIFFVLHWLFENIGNFGVAIIILTLLVRLLLFPKNGRASCRERVC